MSQKTIPTCPKCRHADHGQLGFCPKLACACTHSHATPEREDLSSEPTAEGLTEADARVVVAALKQRWDGLPGRLAPHVALDDVNQELRRILADRDAPVCTCPDDDCRETCSVCIDLTLDAPCAAQVARQAAPATAEGLAKILHDADGGFTEGEARSIAHAILAAGYVPADRLAAVHAETEGLRQNVADWMEVAGANAVRAESAEAERDAAFDRVKALAEHLRAAGALPDFAPVLAEHQFSVHRSPEPIFADNPTRLTQAVWGCTCGWVGSDVPSDRVPGEVHRDHLASVLRAAVEGGRS